MVCAQLLHEAARAPWLVAVCRSLPNDWLRVLQSSPARKLVLVPDALEASQVEAQLLVPAITDLEIRVAWLSATGGEASWFRYNDARCDGPLPPAHWQAQLPNLQLQSAEVRPQISLQSQLEQWEPAQGDGGMLLWGLHDTEPLMGKEALARCSCLAMVGDADDALGDALKRHCLVREPDIPGLWRRDQLRIEHRKLQKRCQHLQNANVKLEQESDQLKQRLAAIDQELDQILSLISKPVDGS
jgi:hypothetical protein